MKLIVLYNGKHYTCRYTDISKVTDAFNGIRIVQVHLLNLTYIVPQTEEQLSQLAWLC